MKYKTPLTTLMFVIIINTLFIKQVNAAWENPAKLFVNYGVDTLMSYAVEAAQEQVDINKLVLSNVNALLSAVMSVTAGGSPDEFSKCGIKKAIKAGAGEEEDLTTGIANFRVVTQIDQNTVTDEDYANVYNNATECDNEHFLDKQSFKRGGLLGMASVMEQSLIKEPIPINMAAYTKYMAQKTPIIKNTAFAANAFVEDAYGVEGILSIWTAVRNLAYGILSVVMIIIGIMIMTQQKGGQTTVTLQYAIPRIFISVVLITFSYPIGALFVKFGNLAYSISNNLVIELLAISTIQSVSITDSAQEWYGIIGSYLSYGISGSFISILGLITFIICVILLYIKSWYIYFKMIMSIIGAPLIFCIGAIPGKEDLIKDWFLDNLINVGTLFLMFFFLYLGLLFPKFIVNTSTVAGSASGGLVAIQLMSAGTFGCMFMAFKAGSMVETAVKGGAGGGKKK